MGFVSEGPRIWSVTDAKTRKCKQISANPNVAIAVGDALEIEGVASLRGHPMDEEDSDYIRILRERDPDQLERGSRPGRALQRCSTRVIEVNPTRILYTVWTPNWDLETDFKPHALVLNVAQEKAYEIHGSDDDVTEMYRSAAYWA